MHGIEGFGAAYELPNKEAYNETCAAVGNVFFNYRMFLLHKDGRFMDVAEVALLNNALAGVNMAGNEFFYVNPLEADGQTEFNHGNTGRSPWFGTACCPSNIARLIPQVSGMMYAYTENEIYAIFYGSNSTTISLKDIDVTIKQEANYPFEGDIKFTLMPERLQQFAFTIRIPTWAREQFVPGDLYQYVHPIEESWEIELNGEKISADLEKGFVTIDREWKAGDELMLSLPMPVRFNTCIDSVEANRGRIAITKGPLVYCAEEVDNGGKVQQFLLDQLPESLNISTSRFEEGILQNVVQISIPAKTNIQGAMQNKILKLVPYYTWNNRGNGSMIVWVNRQNQNNK